MVRYGRSIDRVTEAPFRHVLVPQRVIGDQVVLALPRDGTALLLAPTAALVWSATERWTTFGELERFVGEWHPDVARSVRLEALREIVRVLWDEGLIERAY